MSHCFVSRLDHTVYSRSKGSAYNKNFPLTTFFSTFFLYPHGLFFLFPYYGYNNISLRPQVSSGPLNYVRGGVNCISFKKDYFMHLSFLKRFFQNSKEILYASCLISIWVDQNKYHFGLKRNSMYGLCQESQFFMSCILSRSE